MARNKSLIAEKLLPNRQLWGSVMFSDDLWAYVYAFRDGGFNPYRFRNRGVQGCPRRERCADTVFDNR